MFTEDAAPTRCQEALAWCGLFEGVRAAALAKLARCAAIRAYAGGESLYMHDDPAEGLFVVLEGAVRIYRLGVDGREQVLHVLGPGEPVGEAAVFEGATFPASASAQGPVRVLWVGREAFLSVGREEPELLLGMLAVMARRLRGFVGLIDDLSLKEVSARLAKHLVDLSVRQRGVEIELETTKALLAARLGTTAETLSRTLARMKARGIVRIEGPRIAILDREAMLELAAGEKL